MPLPRPTAWFVCPQTASPGASLRQPTVCSCQARSIDSLFIRQGQRLDYIKADLEGTEVSMLRGAIETIRACAPRIAITTYHRREHAEQIAALLRDIHPDYHVFVKGIMPQDGQPVMLHAWMDDKLKI